MMPQPPELPVTVKLASWQLLASISPGTPADDKVSGDILSAILMTSSGHRKENRHDNRVTRKNISHVCHLTLCTVAADGLAPWSAKVLDREQWWPNSCPARKLGHYLNQCWPIADWTIRNDFLVKFESKETDFNSNKPFANVVG